VPGVRMGGGDPHRCSIDLPGPVSLAKSEESA
jgi:hypothetical protein